MVAAKLGEELDSEAMIEVFVPKYYLPELDPNTPKHYWFEDEPRVDIEVISSVVAYAVQCLRL
jgi:hypothetical protein